MYIVTLVRKDNLPYYESETELQEKFQGDVLNALERGEFKVKDVLAFHTEEIDNPVDYQDNSGEAETILEFRLDFTEKEAADKGYVLSKCIKAVKYGKVYLERYYLVGMKLVASFELVPIDNSELDDPEEMRDWLS